MKIALSIESFSASKGGGEGYANNFAKQLINNGHEVHVFASSSEGYSEKIHSNKVHVINTPKPLRILSFAFNSERLLKQYKFDVIIGFGGTWFIDVYRPGGGTEKGWLKQNLLSIDNAFVQKLNVVLRKLSPSILARLYVDSKIYHNNKLKLVIANSNMVKSDIMKYYNFPENKVKVVYNGVDLQKFHPQNRDLFLEKIREKYGISNDAVVILFMANNFRLKGLHCLIKATRFLKKMTSTPFKVIVAGRGNTRKYCKQAERAGCAQEFLFTGQIKEPAQLYAISDIFVHPTFYDPFANVCLEAMASGLPVITTRYNGAGELITDGSEGFVVDDPKDINILAENIAYFFDESKRMKAGQRARLLAEHFPWEKNYSEIFKALIGIN